MKAFEGKSYRNLFAECGKTEKEISQRLEEIWNVFFYGSEEERIYHPVGPPAEKPGVPLSTSQTAASRTAAPPGSRCGPER